MGKGWPTRYRCRKCTRATSSYPLFCTRPQCPVKRDVVEDNWFNALILIGFCVLVFLESMGFFK